MELKKASIGSIVHYVVDSGEVRPAIVIRPAMRSQLAPSALQRPLTLVHVFAIESDRCPVGVNVFMRGECTVEAAESSVKREPGTWHWPDSE